MPLLTSPLLIRTHALTLLTTSYLLLTTPSTLLTTPSLLLLGEAMQIRPATYQPSPSRLSKNLTLLSPQSTELLALLALTLALHALSSLIFCSHLAIPDPLSNPGGERRQRADKAQIAESLHTLTASQSSHLNLAFIHIVASGAMCAWIYVFHSTRSHTFLSKSPGETGGLGGVLGNQVVFSASFMDMLFWGYVWTVIREERREVLERVQGMRVHDDDE